MACSFLALCGSYLLLILRESSDWAQTMQTRSNCNSRYSVPFLTAFLMSYCNIPNKHGLRKIKHLFSHCKLLKLWVTPQKREWTSILALCFSTSLHKNIQCGYRLPIASEHREKSWNKTRHRVYKNSSGGNVGILQHYVGYIFIIAEHLVLQKKTPKSTTKNSTTPSF